MLKTEFKTDQKNFSVPNIMSKILIAFLFIICINAFAAEDSTYFYGVNNTPADPQNAILKVKVIRSSSRKYKISTYVKQNDQWVSILNKNIRIKNGNEFLISEYGKNAKSKKYTRLCSENPDGMYDFTEIRNKKVIRTGTSRTSFPLTLEGKEITFYDNRQKKSESVYRNNQLISNVNWLKDGEKYIDNIFYSVDKYPVYKAGTKLLHKYLSEYINQSGYRIQDVDGNVTIGFVITKNGEIEGVYVVNGIISGLDEIVADAVESIPGKWEPAKLNNEKVNCFLTIPVNFRQQASASFDYLEFTYSNWTWMMYWSAY